MHVFEWPGKELTIYGLRSRVKRAHLLATNAALHFTQKDGQARGYTALAISLPPQAPDAKDWVIALAITAAADADPSLQQPDGAVTVSAGLKFPKIGD